MICEILNLSKKAMGLFISLGLIIGICIFEKIDGMSKATLIYYNKLTPEQIYQSTMVTWDWSLCWTAMGYLLYCCTLGAIIMMVIIEITVRTLALFNWKNNWVYRFLSNK
jgi:hypothetical protein